MDFSPPSSPPNADMDLASTSEIPASHSSSCIQVAWPNPLNTLPDSAFTFQKSSSPLEKTPSNKRPSTTCDMARPKRAHTDLFQKHQTSREAILAARDLIVLASQLSLDRSEQSTLLDLLQIFREYTEKGKVNYASSILATQVASLEIISKRIDNKTKQPKPGLPAQLAKRTPLPEQQAQPQGTKASYAQVVSSQTKASEKTEWSTIQRKTKPQSPNQGLQSLKSRQLILMRTVQTSISPLKIRDAINDAFSQKGIQHKVIASVSLSKTNQNIILTTMQSFTGQYLLDQKAIWEKEVSFSKAQLNQSWFKVAIHGVPVDTDLSSVPSEISLYNNGLQVIGDPYWLTSAEKRQVQKAGSIVAAFATEKEASTCIRNRVYIAGISARVEKVYSTPMNAQCRQCQGFGHLENRCRNHAKCQICGESHPTVQHLCNTCQTRGKKCMHTLPKCANCKEPHTADAKDCEVRLAIQHRPSPETIL